MTSVLRALAVVSALTLLTCLLLPPSSGLGFQGFAAAQAWDIAFDLALATGVVGLVATAQRASWGWFTALFLAVALGVLSPIIVDVLLPYLGLALPLNHLICAMGSFCPVGTYIAALLRGLAPLMVLLSTVSRPQPVHRAVAQAV